MHGGYTGIAELCAKPCERIQHKEEASFCVSDPVPDKAIYQANLRIIDKRRTEIEERVGSDTDDSDLINLHELESTLVYFATSLRANGVVLDRLTRYKRLEQYPEDKELLDDVIVENRQAIEMTTIYRDIINGTRELMSSLLDNRLNNVMKYLTSITIVMAIPTVISGIYGMNVNENWMPFANTPHGFLIICIITLLICVITMLFLRKKKNVINHKVKLLSYAEGI